MITVSATEYASVCVCLDVPETLVYKIMCTHRHTLTTGT